MKKKCLLILLAGIILSSCKTNKVSLEGKWEISELIDENVSQEICLSDIEFKLVKNNIYEINGQSGVNNYFGSVEINEDKFIVHENFGSTKMAGHPKAMEFEDNFLYILMNTSSWKIYKEKNIEFLKLTSRDGKGILVFTKN